MKKSFILISTALLALFCLFSCSKSKSVSEKNTKTTITLFAAKSLNSVMDTLIAKYIEENPNTKILTNYDSSGTLMVQIEEGAACDVFFSAAQKQMDELQKKDFLVAGTRHNVVNNQVCVVTYKGSGTEVKGLASLDKAKSMALADGSVPVGKYTREALVASGILEKTDNTAKITTVQVSAALSNIEINECANVGAVVAAVVQGSNEVGTVYYSDTYGNENNLKILEYIPYTLTGNVIYPIAQIKNNEANSSQEKAALDFINFVISSDAKEVFDTFYFDTNVSD